MVADAVMARRSSISRSLRCASSTSACTTWRGRAPGRGRWRVVNPRGAHAVACGLDAELEVEIDGHVGYYCAGMNQHADGAGATGTPAPAWRRT